MSDVSSNPYQSPQHEADPVNQVVQGGTLSDNAIGYLKGASPWIRFLAIMGFIGCGSMLIGGIVMFIAGTATASMNIEELVGDNAIVQSFVKSFTGIIGFVYVGGAVLAFFPAKFLWAFGSKLRNFIQSNSAEELEVALKNNKSFWKYSGIITIVSIALVPIMFIIGIVAAVVGMTSHY